MSDYVFTTGTCLKSEVYSTIKNAMIAAGWQNVSGYPTTDFDVMYSTGATNDKNLYIQLRASNTTAVNPIDTTDYCVMSYRLINKYTPKTGAAGTFERPSEAWKSLYIVPSTGAVAKATTMTYRIHANKNRIIVSLETPLAVGLAPVVFYIGLPDINYCTETDSRGLLVATSAYALAANMIDITNAPAEMASTTASSTRNVYATLASKNPNGSGKYLLSDMYYGNATEGMRGKLTGIYALPNANILNGDIIQVGTKTFYVLVTAVASYSSFPSAAIAIQVS